MGKKSSPSLVRNRHIAVLLPKALPDQMKSLKEGIKKALESLEMDEYSAGITLRRLIPHEELIQA